MLLWTGASDQSHRSDWECMYKYLSISSGHRIHKKTLGEQRWIVNFLISAVFLSCTVSLVLLCGCSFLKYVINNILTIFLTFESKRLEFIRSRTFALSSNVKFLDSEKIC